MYWIDYLCFTRSFGSRVIGCFVLYNVLLLCVCFCLFYCCVVVHVFSIVFVSDVHFQINFC